MGNSENGPICVLLVNHETNMDTPVVMAIPPSPNNKLTHTAYDNNNTKDIPTTSSTAMDFDDEQCLTKDEVKQDDKTQWTQGLLTPEVSHGSIPSSHRISSFNPLLRFSPPPGDQDYYFNLDVSEGVCDLFDIPQISVKDNS